MLRKATVRKNVGRRIGELRVVQGMTQAQLAEALDISVKYQQLVESGVENLTLNSLVDYADHFGVEVAVLLQPPSSARPKRGRPPKKR